MYLTVVERVGRLLPCMLQITCTCLYDHLKFYLFKEIDRFFKRLYVTYNAPYKILVQVPMVLCMYIYLQIDLLHVYYFNCCSNIVPMLIKYVCQCWAGGHFNIGPMSKYICWSNIGPSLSFAKLALH